MKRLLLAPAVLAAILSGAAVPLPANANVFCPATIATLADVSFAGRPNTYGFLLDIDRGDTRSARVRIDTDVTRYAVDVNDVPLMTFGGVRLTRYFTLPAGEHPSAAWVQSTGLGAAQRLECPITAPWSPNAAPPVTPSGQLAADRDRKTLVDGFGAARNAVVTPVAFGPAAQQACSQPFAAAHALAPIKPAFPAEARAVNATGVVELTVDVDDTGALVGAAVSRSSGFAPLDRAALETAKHAKYAAASFSCRPTATTLTITTGFGV
jgi:TonB family protein